MTVVLAWIPVALGLLIVCQTATRLTVGRTGPEMSEPGARSLTWLQLGAGVLSALTGLTILATEVKDGPAEWATRLAIFAVVGLMLATWVRRRMQGQLNPRDDG
jgi:hypothetical protein